MAKLAQNFAKYLIHAKLRAKGIVERPDVIGAVFGQTEGLLGTELDLRELQRTGRIGRIEVDVKTTKGLSFAEVCIPSSLDASETSLIAASMETIDKVGPCDAEIEITNVEDVRSQKRKYVIERAKEILKAMIDNGTPDSQKITELIKEAVRTTEVSNYNGLSCGPDIRDSEEIIIVEGRADVINLLRHGIRNSVAIEGSKIPDAVIELTKEKTVTAFLDGDRGGDLDLKRLLAIADIDYIARADKGKEVEELTKKQIYKSLRERVPADQNGHHAPKRETVEYEEEEKGGEEDEDRGRIASLLNDLVGTRAAYLLDKNQQIVSKVPISEIVDALSDIKNINTIIFDGKINQSIVDIAAQHKIECVVGMDFKENVNNHNVKVLTLKDCQS